MKSPSRHFSRHKPFIAAALSLATLTPFSRASVPGSILYFDTNSSLPGSGVVASATYTWDATTPLWSTDPTGASPTQTWDSADIASFSAGSDATNTFSLSIRGAPSPAGINVNQGSLSFLHGSSLSLDNATLNIAAGSSLSILATLGGTTFTKAGPGTLILDNSANTFTGGFAVNGGVVQFSGENVFLGSGPSYTGASPLSVIPNYIRLDAGTLRDTNTVSAPILLNSNKGIYLSPGGGTIDIPDTAISNSHSYAGPISGPGSFTKTGPGLLTLGPAASLSYAGPTTVSAGTLRLSAANQLPATSSLSISSGATLDLVTFNQSVASLTGAGKIINVSRLTLSPATDSTFAGTLSGAGGLTVAGSAFQVLASTQSYLGPTILSGAGIRLAANNVLPTSADLQFNPASPASSPTLDLNGYSQTLSSITNLNPNVGHPAITNSSSTPSTLTINNSLPITLNAAVTGSISLVKSNTGTLILSHLSLPSLSISAGTLQLSPTATPARLNTLTITSGSLDLTTTDLILEAPDVNLGLSSLRTYLANHQLLSSTANADPLHLQTVAYASAASLGLSTYDSQPVTANSLITKLTLAGDANLDGLVNANDYALLDRGYAKTLTTWTNGDFNYDGVIDQNDYFLIDKTYLHQTQSPAFSPETLLSERESQFGDAYVSELLTSLPEPSPFLIFVFCLLWMERRRSPFFFSPRPNQAGHSE